MRSIYTATFNTIKLWHRSEEQILYISKQTFDFNCLDNQIYLLIYVNTIFVAVYFYSMKSEELTDLMVAAID